MNDLEHSLAQIGDRFNLGEYEIEAYITVLEHGVLTASEIADQTSIPQPRVYDTVRSLSNRGLVELRESRPMKIRAIDPDDAFADVKTSVTSLVEELTARYTAPARETEAVSLVKSRTTILRYLEEVIESAEYELLLSITPDLLERFSDLLERKKRDGVSTDLLLAPSPNIDELDDETLANVAMNVRTRRGITTPIIAVADGKYSVYATQDALRDDQDRYGVIFNRSALGFLVSGFFGTVLWTTTEKTLVEDGSERPFPRHYATMRRVVKDILAIDDEFTVIIEGRDVETGVQRVIDGRVVDTTLKEDEQVASLTVETDDGTQYTVGGRVSAFEDVEARKILLDRA